LYTGLARVNRHLIRGLSDAGHEVMLAAWGWDQLAYPLNDDSKWIYKDKETDREHVVFPVAKDAKQLLLHTYEILKNIEVDVLLTVGDYWNFAGFEMLKPKLDYGYKWVAYYTIEASPINEKYYDAFSYIDHIASPSMFGKSVVEESFGMDCHYIPYGIEHDVFYKMDEDIVAKERSKRGLDGKFRFINVSRNQHRKNIPAFLKALKIANESNPNIVGYLHSNIFKISESQIHIENLVKRYGIEDIVEFPDKKLSINIGYEDSDLNLEYNCSNALVLCSVAEGFGLPLIEAQKCGLPVIGTRCSSIPELVGDRGFLVDPVEYCTNMEHVVNIACPYKLGEEMLKMSYSNMDTSENIEFAKGFSWKRMNEDIENLFKGIKGSISIPVDVI